MISEWLQLRKQQESEQHFVLNDFDLWNSNDIDVAEYYSFNSVNNSDSEVENIVTADERHQKVFVKINTIVDQLSSEKLFKHYQETFMQEMRQWAMTEQELTLKNAESEKMIDLFDNKFWWLLCKFQLKNKSNTFEVLKTIYELIIVI